MRKLFLVLFIMTAFSLTAFAAKYKVNSSGKVTSPKGTTQQGSVLNNGSGLYNTYSSQYYTSAKQVLAGQVGTIDIVMDYSGSMVYWIEAAKNSMAQIVAQLPSTTRIGFRVFGQDGGNNPYTPVLGKVQSVVKGENGKYKVKTAQNTYMGNTSGSCSATKSVASIAANNSSALLAGMNSVKIGGSTPLTFALSQAVSQDFAGMAQDFSKKIVLITDGGENCGGDPCAFARELMRTRRDIHIDVVLVSSASMKLQCLSDETGGKTYTTNDVSGFSDVLIETLKSTPAQPETTIPSQQYEYVKD